MEDFVELLRTSDPGMLALVESLLDSADIPFVIEGRDIVGVLPIDVPGFFGSRGLGARVRVPAESLREARALLAASPGTGEELEDPD